VAGSGLLAAHAGLDTLPAWPGATGGRWMAGRLEGWEKWRVDPFGDQQRI